MARWPSLPRGSKLDTYLSTYEDNKTSCKRTSNRPTQTDAEFVRFLSVYVARRCAVARTKRTSSVGWGDRWCATD